MTATTDDGPDVLTALLLDPCLSRPDMLRLLCDEPLLTTGEIATVPMPSSQVKESDRDRPDVR